MILLGLVEVAKRQNRVASSAPEARPMVKAFIDEKSLGEEHRILAFDAGLAFRNNIWNDMRHLKIVSEKNQIPIRIKVATKVGHAMETCYFQL